MKRKQYIRLVRRLTQYVVVLTLVLIIAALWLCFLPFQFAIRTLDRRDR